MNYHPSSHGTGGAHAGHATDSASQTSLPGRLRPPLHYGVWAGWFVIMIVTLGVFAIAAPARYAQLTHACVNQRCATAAVYLVALDVCTALAWLVLALVFGYPLLISANSALTPLAPIALTTLTSLTFLLAPISLAIAILRYRLFDVDTLISRALVYGSLTALLALVYAASTLAFQVVITAFTKHTQPPPLVIVLSTLLVAAAFQPLRLALQRGIDRRFYRRRYDTRATVNAFAASLRHEIDLA